MNCWAIFARPLRGLCACSSHWFKPSTDTTLEQDSWLLVDCSVLHHEPQATQCGNVVRRIAFDSDQISEEACLDSADLIFHMQHARIDRSRRLQRVDDRHSPTH